MIQNCVFYRSTEYYYAMDYSCNSSGISSIAKELENLLELSHDAPILQRGLEVAVHIYSEISPPVSIMVDFKSGSRERSTYLEINNNIRAL